MKVSHVVLIVSLLFALGSWMAALGSWSTALQPDKLGALLLGLASVLGAAFGVNKSDFGRNGNGNGNGKVPANVIPFRTVSPGGTKFPAGPTGPPFVGPTGPGPTGV